MLTDIAHGNRAKNGIDNGMQQHVTITMGDRTKL
jgi:hypothetical protein